MRNYKKLTKLLCVLSFVALIILTLLCDNDKISLVTYVITASISLFIAYVSAKYNEFFYEEN